MVPAGARSDQMRRRTFGAGWPMAALAAAAGECQRALYSGAAPRRKFRTIRPYRRVRRPEFFRGWSSAQLVSGRLRHRHDATRHNHRRNEQRYSALRTCPSLVTLQG